MSDEPHFQDYAHDKLLGGTSPSVDSGPLQKKHHASLAPRAFHEATTDKTLGWELEEALEGLGDLLA